MAVVWFIVGGCVLAALIVLFVVLTVLRFNQLSMARSLCDEAQRQAVAQLDGDRVVRGVLHRVGQCFV